MNDRLEDSDKVTGPKRATISPATPIVPKNEEKKLKDEDDDVALLKQSLVEKDTKIAEMENQFNSLLETLTALKETRKESNKGDDTLTKLQTEIDLLSRQVGMNRQFGDNKKLFREATAADLQDEKITFTARSVLYVVASYRDHRGLEVLPPHKLIVFEYAASDIRKEGNEENIRSFCQYTTNLKTEIEFLRGHPQYGIMFGENLTHMMTEDSDEIQFRARAASELAALPPEAIFDRAQGMNIPGFREKTAEQLRSILVNRMSTQFRQEAEAQKNELARRRVLAMSAKDND